MFVKVFIVLLFSQLAFSVSVLLWRSVQEDLILRFY